MDLGRLRTGFYTIIGDRKSQQDRGKIEQDAGGRLLAVVCDGMGGMEGGAMASATGIQSIVDRFGEFPESWEAGADWIRNSLIRADEEVASLRNASGAPLGGGTTCVLAVAGEDGFLWGSVGDSRIYLLRAGTLHILNRMHNYNLKLDQLLQDGEIDLEERMRRGARGEALISFLGIGGLPMVDVGGTVITWEKGDVLVLCSDGLYKSLTTPQVQAVIEECGGNMEICSRRLCEEAHRLSTKSQDNTTVIAIGYDL